MRVIAPYTRMRPATARLLNRHAPGHVRVPLHGMDGYCRLLQRLWAQGETVVLVEHDMGVHEFVLPQFEFCPNLWCAFSYTIGVIPQRIAALGCVRFRRDLLLAEPDLMDVVSREASGGLPAGDWRRLDVRVMDELRRRGYERCEEHGPDLKHYHRYL